MAIDYVSVAGPDSLRELAQALETGALVSVAVRLGTTLPDRQFGLGGRRWGSGRRPGSSAGARM